MCLGFRIPRNFRDPYLSLSITEFWRRWHITLSRWFRDYLYIPLGGNRRGKFQTVFNLFAVFILCGFWHGASFTFIAWGLYHGTFLALERVGRGLKFEVPIGIRYLYSIGVVIFGWVLFRSQNFDQFQSYSSKMLALDFTAPISPIDMHLSPQVCIAFLAAFYLVWISKFWNVGLLNKKRGLVAIFILLLSSIFMSTQNFNPFIYFRF